MEVFVISSISAFTIVILLLVVVLLFAQGKLVQSGPVQIVVNGDEQNPIITEAGATLLSTLSARNIFLPSACGGGGTCAMCTCQVLEGGGDILPTEVGQISRADAKDKVRLSCQVKVKNDMTIRIPDEIFGIKKWECEVVSNYNVSTFIKEFIVRLPKGEKLEFQPGGYIQIDVPPIVVDFAGMDITPHPDLGHDDQVYRKDWDNFGMWDLKMANDEPIFRAYSMANYPEEGDLIILNVRVALPPWDQKKGGWKSVNPGICSSYMFSCKPGDKVTISGPYGEFFINQTSREMIYVGGGAGMAPLRSHVSHLFHSEKSSRKVSYWYGGRSRRELFYLDQFRNIEKDFPNFRFYIALSEPLEEDNWKKKENLADDKDGFVGFIHQCLYENYLKSHKDPEEIEFYFCGPPQMNSAVIGLLDGLGIPEENIRFDDFGV